jgi:2',3'-cyclic-nucleotide 2'-phosphodiesterase/3'-nucleotidase
MSRAPLRLRIVATSDLHAQVMPWDYHSNRRSAAQGLARTAQLIRQARAEVPGTLVFDNGDFLNGSPLAEVAAERCLANPVLAAMNELGYDAVTLGNHEFSHGLEALHGALSECRFPLVSSNMLERRGPSPAEDHHIVAPRLILTREIADEAGEMQTLRIGVLGFAPPQVVQWDRAVLGAAMEVRDILEAAEHHVACLRQEGADLVIALSHSGIIPEAPRPMMENASAALALVPGIDAIVAGHTHQAFPGPAFPAGPGIDPLLGTVHGKPVVMPGFFGSHLGVIDLELAWGPEGWRVRRPKVSLRPIARRAPSGRLSALTRSDPKILAMTEAAHQATLDWAAETVAVTAAPIHSYFAMVAPAAPVRLIARAQADYIRRRLAGTELGRLPLVSAAAPFHSGGRGGPHNFTHVGAGRLTRRHIFDLYPHPNAIAALRVTGEMLAQWLERSFSQFRQIRPGAQDADLIDPDFPSFNFDTIEGLSWEVDLSSPARYDSRGQLCDAQAQRILRLSHQGHPVDPAQSFLLATNSYRATGSGGFPVGCPERLVFKGPQASRDILSDHVARLGTVPPAEAPSWRFRPLPGTSVCFDTAPQASRYLAELGPLRPEALEITAEGFRRFRLHL